MNRKTTACILLLLCLTALAACTKHPVPGPSSPNARRSSWKIDGQTYYADSTEAAGRAQHYIRKHYVISPGDTLFATLFFERIPEPDVYTLMSYPDYLAAYFHTPHQFHLRVDYHNKIYRNYRVAALCGRVDTLAGIFPTQSILAISTVTLENAADTTDRIQVSGNLATWSPSPTAYAEALVVDGASYPVRTDEYSSSGFYKWRLRMSDTSFIDIGLGNRLQSPDFQTISSFEIPKANSAFIDLIAGAHIFSSMTPSQAGKPLHLVQDGSAYKVESGPIYLIENGDSVLFEALNIYINPQ